MKRAAKKLLREQRNLSRKYRKGPKSQNFRKRKIRVARAHERVANMRLDFLHKVSTAIGETQAVVVVGDLKIRNMTKRARGTREAPGLNLSLLDYKLSRRGGRLVRVDPKNTSRTCFDCGQSRRKTGRIRPPSGASPADTNAAKDILREGYARSACSPGTPGEFVA